MLSQAMNRSGAALVMVMIISAGFIVMCALATDRMIGAKKIVSVDLAKQKAGAAAETVAAMIESRLMDSAANYDKLITPVENGKNEAGHPWWGLKGCVWADSSGTNHGPGFGNGSAIWINGCLVRWTVEPSRVYNTAWSGTPSSGSQFVVNPPKDPSLKLAWETAAKTNAIGSLNNTVNDFYHFRVVAQACALTNPNDGNGDPWRTPGLSVASAQSLHILQIQSLQLFKYALFYAADGPIGDLDLLTGGTIAIKKGSVHSNGAIYIRGGEWDGFNTSPKNWHMMASGDLGTMNSVDTNYQSVLIGDADNPVTITGVDGIYRMGKTANCLAALNMLKINDNAPFVVTNPSSVPRDSDAFVSDNDSSGIDARLDLNGDVANSQRHKINGVPFHRFNDSRSAEAFATDFMNAARDSTNGGSKVRTLQNIPELGGRPFEPQAVVFTVSGAKNPLYGMPTSNPLSFVSRYPVKKDDTGTPVVLTPLFYSADPTAGAGAVSRTRNWRKTITAVTTAGGRAITAEDMPLWWNSAFTEKDVLNPSQEMALSDQIPHSKRPLGANAGDGSAYSLSGADSEARAWIALDGTLNHVISDPGAVSFPGVPFMLPPAFGGVLWNPQFYGCGFSPREVKGYYLEEALFGNLAVSGSMSKQQQYYNNSLNSNLAQNISRTGLVIRERRWQQRPAQGSLDVAPHAGNPLEILNDDETPSAWNVYWPGDWLPGATKYLNAPDFAGRNSTNLSNVRMDPLAVLPIPRPLLAAAPTPLQRLDYVQYLCSQYSVIFCGRNITAPFFGQILSAANPVDFIVSEDEFVDSRESGYLWGMYGANGDLIGAHVAAAPTDAFFQKTFFAPDGARSYDILRSTIPGGATPENHYRQNVLTVHMRAFQNWLQDTPMSTLGYKDDATKAKDHFTGVLYCSRSRRSESYHPLFTPELVWPGDKDRVVNNVEDVPARLTDQTHFRAYWFTDIANTAPPKLPRQTKVGGANILYPPVNFPWNWREPSGPFETSRCAVRIRGQTSDSTESDASYYRVFWNHASDSSTSDALGTSAFTLITPQRFYMQGNFCELVPPSKIENDTTGEAHIMDLLPKITPCAVFADNYTTQSVKWRDADAQSLDVQDGRGTPTASGPFHTCQFISMVINNSPNAAWNCGSFGGAGQEATFRTMENWQKNNVWSHMWWSGSQVVMNIGRYHHSGHGYVSIGSTSVSRTKSPANMSIRAFDSGKNHYIFNTNLFSPEGRPPLSPCGVSATRVVNQLTYYGE